MIASPRPAMLAFLCHRLPERSFLWLWDPPWLCARCTGLYAALFVGIVWLLWHGERGRLPVRAAVLAAALSVGVIALEKWWALDPGNGIRCLTALPLGFVLGQGLALPLHRQLHPPPQEETS